MTVLLVLGAAAVAACLPVIWWAVSGDATSGAAVSRNLTGGLALDARQALLARSARERAVGPAVEHLAERARRLTPVGVLHALERRVLLAGTPAGWPMERVLAAKLVFALVGLGMGALRLVAAPSFGRLLIAGGATALGFFGPDIALYNSAQKRQDAIRRALPDTLDQLTIGVEAGLAFEAALSRVGRTGSGPLADEIVRTLQDVQAGMGRADALRRLTDRTDVPDLRHFVTAVLQAESYGVPMAKVLRVQAGEQRLKRRQEAEEKAMKLPVKVLFPTVFFILPALFIVLLAPAAIQIAGSLG